jgi:phosphatidylserine/phosphatidylglycerophosphate/cardiolipin synthase-like enzyme
MERQKTLLPRLATALIGLACLTGLSAQAATTYTMVLEPSAGLTPIYNLVTSAKKTIDITIYELVDTTMTSLLATAAADGVTVRVILDQNNEKSKNTTAYNYLTAHKVSCHWANTKYACTHQKSITIDAATTNAQSAIMTLNLVSADYPTTRDFAVITNDAADIAAIETTFNADFTNATVTPPDGDNLVWSPTNSLSALEGIINGATKTIIMSEEELSDSSIVTSLTSALGRGVAVTMVQENTSSDYTTELTTLKKAGAKIAVYTSTASTAYYIHGKAILADYGLSTAKMFIGSENITSASLGSNRELGLIFSDTASMTAVEGAITADYNGGTKF